MDEQPLIRIFFDMDGVLADFDGAFSQITGFSWNINSNEMSKIEKWNHIRSHPTFFADLNPIQDSIQMFEEAETLVYKYKVREPEILSAVSKHIPNCTEQKKFWLDNYVGINNRRIHLVWGAEAKLDYCSPGDVLIDDKISTCNSWNELGGFAIFFISPKDTLSKLYSYLDQNYKND